MKVTAKDIKAFWNAIDDDIEVSLDQNSWEDFEDHNGKVDLSPLFHKYTYKGVTSVIINN